MTLIDSGTTDAADSHALDYRALMTCEAPDGWLTTAEAELETWLTGKRWNIDAREDGEFTSGSRSLQILRHTDGRSRSLRARLIERETPQGTWTTELIAHDKRGDGDWIRIHVENDRGNFVDVPNLAKGLMQALPLGDSSLQFVDKPQIFGQSRIDDLLDILCDEERHGLVFVAGTDTKAGIPFDPFVKKVHEWTRQVYGLGQVIVLDPAATDALEQELDGHAVPPWTLRTYYPGVDPASVVDARRHRILSTSRLAGERDAYVRKLLGRVARLHAARAQASNDVLKLRRTFQRLENKFVFDSSQQPTATPVPTKPARAAQPLSGSPLKQAAPAENLLALERRELTSDAELIRGLSARLGIDLRRGLSVDQLVNRLDQSTKLHDQLILAQARLERAEAQVEGLQGRVEAAEDAFRKAEKLLDDGQEDRALLQDHLENLAAQCKWLQSELVTMGAYDTAYGATPDSFTLDYPSSFEDLLERRDELEAAGIVLCCAAAKAISLDEHDTLQSAVRTTWDALVALRDYLRARQSGDCEHSVDHYLKHTPPGYSTFPPGKHAHTESATTMKNFGGERVFAVPTSVEPSGSLQMTAHFKLAQIGMVSPRLYYIDRWATDGRIYVGYIGPHLTNTQTN